MADKPIDDQPTQVVFAKTACPGMAPDGSSWADYLSEEQRAKRSKASGRADFLPTPPGALLIAEERARQIQEEGWTAEHDDGHLTAELADAGALYALCAAGQVLETKDALAQPVDWPWPREWWKPSTDPIRNLAKAGALIAAEIDRLLRIKDRQAE